MKSIDKLRKMAMDFRSDVYKRDEADYVDEIADEIEAEIAERYMLLPVDKSGETWHIGDKFAFAGADGRKHICTVSGVSDCEVFFYYDEHSSSTKHRHFTARAIAHVKPRTLEDVLEDYVVEYQTRHARSEFGAEHFDHVDVHEMVKRCADEIRDLFGGDV